MILVDAEGKKLLYTKIKDTYHKAVSGFTDISITFYG
jgi:hypothetical protein